MQIKDEPRLVINSIFHSAIIYLNLFFWTGICHVAKEFDIKRWSKLVSEVFLILSSLYK